MSQKSAENVFGRKHGINGVEYRYVWLLIDLFFLPRGTSLYPKFTVFLKHGRLVKCYVLSDLAVHLTIGESRTGSSDCYVRARARIPDSTHSCLPGVHTKDCT